MKLPIITADQRLAEQRGVKGVLVGKSGIGKTSQLWTLTAIATLFFDLEAGDLAVEGWAGDTIRPRTWQECRDFAVFIGGPNPALRDDQPYSQAHFDAVCARFGEPTDLDKYDTVFVDSITVAGRLCLQWSKGQPQAYSEKTGKPDSRGAYGLMGQEMIAWLTHLQHTRRKNVWFVGILNESLDDFNRRVFSLQIDGSKTGLELPGIVDEVVTLAEVKGDDGVNYRAFVCHTLNTWGYRLHPRLREYLQDHLQLFPAFQSLADIGAKITLLKSLWDEVELLRGDRESVVGMIDELQTTVLDIGDTMNRNMLQLQILMSTRYGNVRSLDAKKSQNRFYQKQTSALSGDVQRLAREAERVEREASIRGRDDLARFIRRQLLTNMMSWQHGLSDMQTFLRNEIYRLRVVEQDLKLLARTDMLLRQQPGWRGFEVDFSGEIPDFLLATCLSPLVAHSEPMESDSGMVDEMATLARALPSRAAPPIPAEEPKRYTRIVDPPAPRPITPAMKALGRLLRDVSTAESGLSLIEWRDGNVDAQTMPPSIWLVLALAALRAGQYEVHLVHNLPRDGERFAHTFRDARAFPKRKMIPNVAHRQGAAV